MKHRAPVVRTIGHSIRPIAEFLGLLEAHGVRALIDVRAKPRSMRHPQFNEKRLAAALEEKGIRYVHRPDLGGLRTPRPDSRHRALRVDAFRGYANHMETAEFARGSRRYWPPPVRRPPRSCAPRRTPRSAIARC